jgi:hypothetical protein
MKSGRSGMKIPETVGFCGLVCAFCNEYPCERLGKFFETDPEAKTRLQMVRNILSYMT